MKYATFTKFDGRWCVKMPAGATMPLGGSEVQVRKASGEIKTVTVGGMAKMSDAGNVYNIEERAPAPRRRAQGRRARGGSRCRGCGGPIRHAAHHRAMEGYCGDCAFDEFDM